MPEPLLSILVPVRNGAMFIVEALRPALSIDAPLEIVVQDCVSTDDTRVLVERLNDPRVRLTSERDEGQADALNRALRSARGEWVLWLNADDTVDPRAVEALVPLLTSTRADIVYGDFNIADAQGEVLRRYTCPANVSRLHLLTRGMRVFSGSMFFRRRYLDAEGGFDERWHYCMDYELLVRLAAGATFLYTPGVIGTLRLHPTSKSMSRPWRFVQEYRAIHKLYPPERSIDRAFTLFEQLRIAVFTAGAPIRYSRAWARVRPTKGL